MKITNKIVVKGLVQGIGYRPFVAELAQDCGIGGWVRNTDGIVTILAAGEENAMKRFLKGLKEQAPFGAKVEELTAESVENQVFSEFAIIGSNTSETVKEREIPFIPADLPVCKNCLAEMQEETNRRYRHPFISCTSCGPRYSIIERLPYDRETISMNRFSMCALCGKEYGEHGNRRRHAQTIACKECGPALSFSRIVMGEADQTVTGEAAYEAAVRFLSGGGILAVKDIGGYHLACTPFSEETVQTLRVLKGRETKPFAVLFPDIKSVSEYCSVNENEKALLLSPARPIVLLKKQEAGRRLAFGVCAGSPQIGAMLPCNPLQVMLAEELGPLIMTSANTSGEVLILDDEEMMRWMEQKVTTPYRGREVSLAVLSHDRPIVTPLDDSVVQSVCGRTQIFRRARGYVPNPVETGIEKNIFAAGGDLKSCFCYTGKGKAYLSQYLGDLGEEACLMQYRKEAERMRRLFGFSPEIATCDMHPGYASVRQANYFQDQGSAGECYERKQRENAGGQKSGYRSLHRIQHHEAHAASVIAEHRLNAPVLGFAFDGTGYGPDHTVWGSEALLWNGGANMIRFAHLKPVCLTGGDEGARNADLSFYGYLASFRDETKERIYKLGKVVPGLDKETAELVGKAVSMGIQTVKSSSMGRLFDAVSAFLDICHYNSYESEAAIRLEWLADQTDRAYPLEIGLSACSGQPFLGDAEPLFAEMAAALRNGVLKQELARGFLYAVSDFICRICEMARIPASGGEQNGIRQIALTGGTFQNRILLEKTITRLESEGFSVYINEQVPPGDGGICLGQAYLCAQRAENE